MESIQFVYFKNKNADPNSARSIEVKTQSIYTVEILKDPWGFSNEYGIAVIVNDYDYENEEKEIPYRVNLQFKDAKSLEEFAIQLLSETFARKSAHEKSAIIQQLNKNKNNE